MTQAIEKKTYTTQEYFEFELGSAERHEYDNGELRLMTGGTPNHNRICRNLLIALELAFKEQPYETFVTDQRLWIPERNLYTYPDIMVLEKPIQLQESRTDTVMNPCLIAEVLSKSTKDYDRSEKFLAYRTIETFQEYLLVNQYQIQVEHCLKTAANQWLLSEYTDPQVILNLNSVGLKLKIADIYKNVEFSEA
ncbi:MAG: Uma2 family endonuclease [Pleurocapsa minor HA4230-MV1]|jgi:Uma2 family endonuclease|nr:Uma2 family endonuclease [Pleurocapsa minor HA4230-MV1]